LRHPVAGIGAPAASATIAKVGRPIFFIKVRVQNVELGLAGVVLTDPEVSVGFDIKEEFPGQTSPVVNFALVVVLAALRVDAGIEQRWRLYAPKELRINLLLRGNTKLALTDNDGI
jgi:hypothetical protein